MRTLLLLLAGCALPAATVSHARPADCEPADPVSCFTEEAPVVPVVRTPPPAPCLRSAPPPRPQALLAGSTPCPGQYVSCLSVEDEAKLSGYLRSLEDWTADASAKCGRR
jgi:hypothetical protein